MKEEHWLVTYSYKVYDEICAARNSNVEFLDDPEANALINDLENYPHAFVLGCCMDRQIDAKRAWSIPYKIKKILGGKFQISDLCEPSLTEEWYKKTFLENNLHRFNNDMASVFFHAVQHIKNDYDSDASKIWSGCPSSADVVYKFLGFDGVGIKIATMAANILCRQFFIPFSDKCSIDVSPDVHIRRVFARCNLVPYGASREEVIYMARSLCPDFPGIVDGPCWKLGVGFCHPQKPDCTHCPVSQNCPKII